LITTVVFGVIWAPAQWKGWR